MKDPLPIGRPVARCSLLGLLEIDVPESRRLIFHVRDRNEEESSSGRVDPRVRSLDV